MKKYLLHPAALAGAVLVLGVATLLVFTSPASAPLGTRTTNSPSGHGTVSGTVTIGPTAPVCRVGESCSGPGSNLVVQVYSSNGQPFGLTNTGADGRYTLSLPAGTYSVTVKNSLYSKSATVSVRAGQSVTQDLTLDTGIR